MKKYILILSCNLRFYDYTEVRRRTFSKFSANNDAEAVNKALKIIKRRLDRRGSGVRECSLFRLADRIHIDKLKCI